MDVITCIKERRSIRRFKPDPVPKKMIENILEIGRWAPSGVNYQPWLVKVVAKDEIKFKLGECSKYGKIIQSASHILVIFLDESQIYNYTKNVQSIGAFFQTILLASHAHGLGSVWLGEPYNQKEKINEIFGIQGEKTKFMGIIAIGYPNEEGKSKRKEVAAFTEWF